MLERVGMKLRPLALGFLFGAGLGTPALCQQMPQVEAKRETEVVLRLAVFHDTNLARSSRSVAVLRGVHEEDVTTSPEAQVNVVDLLGRQMFFLKGMVGYD